MANPTTSDRYPLDLEGALCPLLDDPAFLLDVYARSGNRHAIKTFCKKHGWPGKPRLSVSVGEEELKNLLRNLFNAPGGRKRLAEVSLGKRGDPTAPQPLFQAIWAWYLEVDADLADKLKNCCHERGEGLLFLSAEKLTELTVTLKGSAPETLERLGRVVLAFAMLQPNDRTQLVEAFVGTFPDYATPMGLRS